MSPVDIISLADHSLLQNVNKLAEIWIKTNNHIGNLKDIEGWSSKELGKKTYMNE